MQFDAAQAMNRADQRFAAVRTEGQVGKLRRAVAADAVAGDSLDPSSAFLCAADQRALAPMPPPVRVSLVAPNELTVVGAVEPQVMSVGVAGGTVSPAFVPTTPQG